MRWLNTEDDPTGRIHSFMEYESREKIHGDKRETIKRWRIGIAAAISVAFLVGLAAVLSRLF